MAVMYILTQHDIEELRMFCEVKPYRITFNNRICFALEFLGQEFSPDHNIPKDKTEAVLEFCIERCKAFVITEKGGTDVRIQGCGEKRC